MRAIGLHLRITTTILDLLQYAIDMHLDTFQCFLMNQATNNYIHLTSGQIRQFLALRNRYFKDLFVHGSYWINLSNKDMEENQYLLAKELTIAKKLGFTHMILHPGSANGWETHQEGVDCVVRVLNAVLKHENDITIVLENTAHGSRAIGSDLHDLFAIQQKIDYPEKIAFCIDTAHAYAFGYAIDQEQGHDEFISLIEHSIGFASVALIHLNDTKEERGSKRDKHDDLGKGILASTH